MEIIERDLLPQERYARTITYDKYTRTMSIGAGTHAKGEIIQVRQLFSKLQWRGYGDKKWREVPTVPEGDLAVWVAAFRHTEHIMYSRRFQENPT